MNTARWFVTILALVGAVSAALGLYRVATAQRRADRARSARERRSAELSELGPAGAVAGAANYEEQAAALVGQLAEAIALESPGDGEIPRSSRVDYVLLAIGILANTAATLVGAVFV